MTDLPPYVIQPDSERLDYPDDHAGPDDAPASERFVVDNTDKAEWACAKLAAATEDLDRHKEQARTWRERIDEWERRVTKRPAESVEFFADLLTDYLARLHDADETIKSLPLPSGDVKSRKVGPRAVVEDAPAFVAWALAQGEDGRALVVVGPSLAAIRQHVKLDADIARWPATGEVVPGVAVTPETRSYSVTVARP